MFRDDLQKCAAIRCLLLPPGIADLWTETGPTSLAIDLLERRGGYLSGGQALMLRVAFDIWNGDGKATIHDVISSLDQHNLDNIAFLMVALNQDAAAIDYWIMRRRDGGAA